MDEVERIRTEYRRRTQEIPSDRYEPAAPPQMFMRQHRERAAVELLRYAAAFPLGDKRILEVGCGTGQWLVDFETWGADRNSLAGIDLIEERIGKARDRLGGMPNRDGSETQGADLMVGDARELPWPNDAFDVVMQSMMFSSIHDDAMARDAAREMIRVLAPGGTILWHDFVVSNPRNEAVSGITKRKLRSLFPGFELRTRRISLAFPLARRLIPLSWVAADLLESMKVLNIQVIGVLQRAG